MRGKPNFDDLEKNLRYVDGMMKIKLHYVVIQLVK